jgi:hypothetical protein
MQIGNIIRFCWVVLVFLIPFFSFSGNYYSDSGGGDPNDVNKWWTSSNSSGSHPTDFVSGDVFVIQSGHTYTTTNAWNVTGTVRVDGTLTIQTANAIKILYITNGGILYGNAQTTITAAASGGTFTIDSGGKYIFNHTTTNNSTTLFNGTESFNSNSTLEFQSFETTNGAFVTCLAASSTNYGNIIWNIQSGSTAYNLNLSNATTRTIAGNFTITKTGDTGSLTWCNNANVARLTISGNFTQTAGTFYVINSGVGGHGAIFEVLGSFTLSGGTFDVGNNFSYYAYTYWGGDVTISGGTFTNGGPNTSNTVYFTKSGTQTYTYSSGTFTTSSTPLVINSGSTVTLASNFSIGLSLTVNSGGTLNIPNPYYTTGAGSTVISSGATLKTGHSDGISTTASTGCLQTTTKTCSTTATYWYNGTSTQYSGNINGTTTGNLTFDNAQGVRMNSNLIVPNSGTLTLIQGYHDLNGYTLQVGTSTAAGNSLSYSAGGFYSRLNDGVFTRYIPSAVTITPNSGNYYGLFPFAKSSMQLGSVQITTSANVTAGGYITMVPTFGYESLVTCSVADGGNTIVRVQEGATFDITACTVTGGTSITIAYTGGTFVATGSLSNLCLATYTSSVVSTLGTHVSATGSLATPTVSRNGITNMSLLNGVSFVMGTYNTGTPMTYVCNLSGTKTVGPTGDYSTLTSAMSTISANGLSGSLILELQTTYVSTSESFPILIDPFNCMGSSNTLTIRPASGATNLSISGSESSSNGVIYFNKGDYVMIDGRPGGTGTTSQLTITNTNSDSPVIAFKNEANYNSVRYCTIQGGNTTTSEGLVFFGGSSASGTNGNKYDTITNNTIKNYSSNTFYYGVLSAGQSGAKLNSYNFINNNNIVDFQRAAIYVSSNSDAWTFSGNHMYQTTSFTPAANVYGVQIATGSGYTISGNYFGGQSTSCGGSAYTLASSANHLFPFYLSTGTTTTTSIQGNIIRNITFNTTSGQSSNAGIFTGIYVTGAGSVNIGTTSGNIVGDTTANTSYDIGITSTTSGGLIQGIYCYASGTVSIQNNLIGDFNTSNVSAKGYTFYGIFTGNTSSNTISSNKIGSYSTSSSIAIGGSSTGTGVCQFFGIYQDASGVPTISSNIISNIVVYGTGASLLYGIYNDNGASTINFTSNTIKSLSNYSGTNTTAKVIGIYSDAAFTTNVTSNSIYSITCANGFFKGIYLNNASGNNTVSLNVIGSGAIGNIAISSTSSCNALTTDVINNHGGIVIGASATTTSLTSNTIKGISGTGASFAYRIAGIAIGNSSTPAVTMTNNLVDIVGASSATAVASTIYGVFSGSTSTTTLTNKKNIIRNLFCANTSAPTIIGWYDNAYNRSYINNFISVKNTDGTTSYNVNSILYGIQTVNTSTGRTAYFYYNTVELGGSVSSNPVTATIYQVSSTANTFIYRNNVFQNNCSSTNSLVFWGASTTPTCTMNTNFYMNSASGTGFAKVNGAAVSSATFNSASDDYGGTSSTYTTTALTISSDASISTMATVYTGADLSGTTDCTEDIYGTNGNRNIASTNVYKGCYEGPVATYYWVGGAGNWSDYSNHWAYSSGGSPVATAAPTSSIDVVFDFNSGSGTVNLNATADCKKLTCSAYTGSIGGSSTLNVNDNFTVVSGMSWTHSGTLNLLATSTGKTFATGGVALTSNVVLNGSGGEYTLQNNTEISGSLTLTAGTLIIGAYTLTLSSNTSPTRTSGVIDASNASAEVAFGNTSSITLPSGMFNGSVSKWKMNGTGGVTLGGNTTISGTLTLTTGKLTIPAATTLTLGTSSSNLTLSGGSSSSYLVTSSTTSILKRFLNSNTSYVFPMGDATYYSPMTFTLNSNGGLSSAYLSTYVQDAVCPGFKEANFTSYISRYWSVDQTGITSPNYDISYTYDDTDITGTESSIIPVKVSSGTWYKPTNASNITNGTSEGTGSITTGTNTLTWAGLTTFSFDTGAGDEAVQLPISLLYFNAKQHGDKVRLDWTTTTEINNDYFTVERSSDGVHFEELFKKPGAGMSNVSLYYFGVDAKPIEGLSYYRLKQTDYDGHYSYSDIESVQFSKNVEKEKVEVSIYPIPAKEGKFHLSFDSESNLMYQIAIYDLVGKLVYFENYQSEKGLNVHLIDLKNIESGIYQLEISNIEKGTIIRSISM